MLKKLSEANQYAQSEASRQQIKIEDILTRISAPLFIFAKPSHS